MSLVPLGLLAALWGGWGLEPGLWVQRAQWETSELLPG